MMSSSEDYNCDDCRNGTVTAKYCFRNALHQKLNAELLKAETWGNCVEQEEAAVASSESCEQSSVPQSSAAADVFVWDEEEEEEEANGGGRGDMGGQGEGEGSAADIVAADELTGSNNESDKSIPADASATTDTTPPATAALTRTESTDSVPSLESVGSMYCCACVKNKNYRPVCILCCD